MQATLGSKRGIEVFFVTLVVVAILRVVLQSYADVPISLLKVANIGMGALFLGGPLLALCFAARDQWSRKMAVEFVIAGLVLQIGCFVLNSQVFKDPGLASQVTNALGQIGLPIWCVGLGALLATLIKDKNIVVPIAIFLAFLDMFLVFSPLGVTQMMIKRMDVLPAIAVQVPRAVQQNSAQHVSPGALAGPADFLFLAMFLVALPALVPIGIVVLLVNWKEFDLTKDEKLSTALVAMLGASLFIWGMFQKPTVLRVDSSPKAAVQAPLESPKKPQLDQLNRS